LIFPVLSFGNRPGYLDSQPFVTLLGIETFPPPFPTDLPYLHSAHGRLRSLAHITRRALQRGVAPSADVICFAGCKDDETSADTFEGGVAVGAMSYALLKILKGIAANHTRITYSQILQQLRAILVPKYSQKPQISGTHPVDMDRDFTL